MSEYRSTTDRSGLAARLRQCRRGVALSHAKPDGDAIGSCLAMRRLLARFGADVEVWLIGPVESALRGVGADDPIRTIDPKAPFDAGELDEFDTILVVDTGTFGQVEPLAEALAARRDRIVGIDHHARGDESLAAVRLVDTSAAATTEIIAGLAEEFEVSLAPAGRGSVGEAIFVGLATDTGWFRFPSAGPRQFALAADLLGSGVEKDRLYAMLEQQGRPQRLALLGRALSSLEVLPWRGDASKGMAVMCLSSEDFRETGGVSTDTGGLVNEPLAVAGVVAAVLLSEPEAGLVRMSFRSAGADALPPGEAECGGAAIDVNRLAAQFGGGGHVAAAGARRRGSLAEVAAEVRAAIVATK